MKYRIKELVLIFFVLRSLQVQAHSWKHNIYSHKTDTPARMLCVFEDSKWFTGTIDGKYKITLYLKYFKTSGEHLGIYSVTGFYYYDKIKTKIPLVGIYDGALVLYKFPPKSAKDSLILNFENYGSQNFWDEIETYKNLDGYEEKFTIGSKGKVQWQSKTKVLPLEIKSADLHLIHTYEYLVLSIGTKETKINVKDLKLTESGFSLVNANWQNNRIRLMLNYSFGSRAFVMGMCGAGTEEGYYVLEFDKNARLVSKQHLQTESCLENIYTEKQKTKDPEQEKWLVKTNDSTETYLVNIREISVVPVREK